MPYVKYTKLISKGSQYVSQEKFIKVIPNGYFSSVFGVTMPNPMSKSGVWIGWSDKEVEEYLQAVRNYKDTLPPKPIPNGNGC